MKLIALTLWLLISLNSRAVGLDPLDGLDRAEWNRVQQDRNVLLPYLMDKLRVLSENELVEQVDNKRLRVDVRIASALVLLRDYESLEDVHPML